MEHQDYEIPYMLSDKDWLMAIGRGLRIYADINKKSEADAYKNYFVFP